MPTDPLSYIQQNAANRSQAVADNNARPAPQPDDGEAVDQAEISQGARDRFAAAEAGQNAPRPEEAARGAEEAAAAAARAEQTRGQQQDAGEAARNRPRPGQVVDTVA